MTKIYFGSTEALKSYMHKEIRTIIGGHLKSHPEFTISALENLLSRLEA